MPQPDTDRDMIINCYLLFLEGNSVRALIECDAEGFLPLVVKVDGRLFSHLKGDIYKEAVPYEVS